MMRNIPHENNEKNKRWAISVFFFFPCPSSRGKIMLENVPLDAQSLDALEILCPCFTFYITIQNVQYQTNSCPLPTEKKKNTKFRLPSRVSLIN
jgi:hypothetical protein